MRKKYKVNYCGKSVHIQSYSVWMRENADQNNSDYGHFSRSERQWFATLNCSELLSFILWSSM